MLRLPPVPGDTAAAGTHRPLDAGTVIDVKNRIVGGGKAVIRVRGHRAGHLLDTQENLQKNQILFQAK